MNSLLTKIPGAIAIGLLAMTAVGCVQNDSKCAGANDGHTKCSGVVEQDAEGGVMATDIEREWKLVLFPGFDKAQLIKQEASAQFSDQGQLSAYMGCNQLGAAYEIIDQERLRFGDVMSTKMACPGEMTLEDQFGALLPSLTHYAVEGHHLTLSNDQGDVIRFVAADWD